MDDGKRALSGADDHTLKLWDIESGKLLKTFRGHSGYVYSVALSNNGKRALSGAGDHTLKLWDIESGQLLKTFQGHEGDVLSVALSNNGKRALSGADDHTLKLWDIESGQLLKTFQGHSGDVYSVALLGDGKRALSGARDNTLKLWDIESGQLLKTFQGHEGPVYSVALLGDGKRALSGAGDFTLKLWDIDSGQLLKTFQGHEGGVYSVALSNNGKRALSGAGDHTLKLWDIESGKLLKTFRGHSGYVNSVALLGDGERALSGAGDHTLKLWDIESGKLLKTFQGHSGEVNSVALLGDGERALSGADDHTLKLWDIESGKLLKTFEGHSGYVTSVALSNNGKRALSGARDHTLKLWDIESGQLLKTFEGHSGPVYSVALSNDGKRALSASSGKTFKLWKLSDIKGRGTVLQYVNAKVVLVGDSGVGKSGLRIVLSGKEFIETKSTHGRFVEVFSSETVAIGDDKETRETLLWDLAGQPGYRLIHQLQLREVSIALVVFDAKSETDPFAGVLHWNRALAQARRLEGSAAVPIKKILVAARLDRGGVQVSNERMQEFLKTHGFDSYYETSAQTTRGVSELARAIASAVPWDELPRVVSNELFESIKSFLFEQKEKGIALITRDNLLASYIAAHESSKESDIGAQFDTCIGRLESRGLIRRLAFGGFVLLQPELLDSYASFIVEAAKNEPDGLGCIEESKVIDADFFMDSSERVGDTNTERLILHAALRDLISFEVGLLEPSGEGNLLVFPSQLTRDNPELPNPEGKAVVIEFQGPLTNIYATLAVRLSRSAEFEKRDFWRNAAKFTAETGGEFGFFLCEIEGDEDSFICSLTNEPKIILVTNSSALFSTISIVTPCLNLLIGDRFLSVDTARRRFPTLLLSGAGNWVRIS